MKRSLIALAAALSMAAAPAVAQTSASKLSLTSARTSAQMGDANQLEGNLLLIGLAAAAVVALAVFVVFDDDDDPESA